MDIDGIREKCVSSLEIPQALVKQYERENFPNDMKTKCYVKCILNNLELFDDTHGFDTERFVTVLGDSSRSDGESFIRTKVLKCTRKNAQSSDACEFAYRSFLCFRKESLVESL